MVSTQTQVCAPPIHAGALASIGWPSALLGQFLLVFALVTLSSPGRIDIVDGQTRYEVARSLVDHGDSIIRDKACWFPVYKGRDGDRYTTYRLPQSALGMAAIVAADLAGSVNETRRQFFFTLISPFMAGLLAVIYSLWFRSLGYGPHASLAWGTAGIFCTPSWYYATSAFDDILGTVAIVLAVAIAWLARERRPVLGALLAGLALAWAVNCKPPLAVFALPALAALYQPHLPQRRLILSACLISLGVVLGVVVFKAYDVYKFPDGVNDMEAEFFIASEPAWTLNPLPGLASLALSPSCGILWYCPTLLLSWRGWRNWRERERLFGLAVLTASLIFTAFISFLTFFKGEPSWGPRYMTPVFALMWVFAPAGFSCVRAGLGRTMLALGVVVQLLGLSVDPQRLFVQLPLRWDYYVSYPWLGFDGSISHLVQRPREIMEVLTSRDSPAAEFGPGPIPTHAGSIGTGQAWVTSMVGLMAAPCAPGPLNGALGFHPIGCVQAPVMMQGNLKRYHIFNSPRPWVVSQWYLSEEARPVDLCNTIAVLAALGLAGLGLMLIRQPQTSQPETVLLQSGSPLRSGLDSRRGAAGHSKCDLLPSNS